MPKYSFIVPVYNTEKYLNQCLKSLVGQTYKDFEIVIINDGSEDQAEKIINKYVEKYNFIKYIKQNNGGLSVARNNGLKKACGQYVLFIDSDDYIEKNTLEKIDMMLSDDTDLLRFQLITEDEKGNCKMKYHEREFVGLDGREAFSILSSYRFVELACVYVYRKKYLIEHNFYFKENMLHEDFGLLPIVIFTAEKVTSIGNPLYHYVQRNTSIMHTNSYAKVLQKAEDFFKQYESLKKIVCSDAYKEYDKTVYLSFISNCAIQKLRGLRKRDFSKYYKKIKQLGCIEDIRSDSFLRKVKKILLKINVRIYLKVIK